MKQYFERVTGYEDAVLPERKTKDSAGYDICAYFGGEIKPFNTVMVATGIKCRMNPKTHLQLHLRSSVGIKNNIMLACGVGIIDADYYNNQDNEGHIYIPIRNLGDKPFTYHKGDRLAQCIFVPFDTTDNDMSVGERTGGYGSTSGNEKWYKPLIDDQGGAQVMEDL